MGKSLNFVGKLIFVLFSVYQFSMNISGGLRGHAVERPPPLKQCDFAPPDVIL